MKTGTCFRGILFILLSTISSTLAPAQVREAWTARFRDPGGMGDVPQGMVLTPDGVVVVGLSQYPDGINQVMTLKYSFDGRLLWQVPYRSGPSNFTYTVRLAGDGAGGVYVAAMTSTNRSVDGSQILVLLNFDAEGRLSRLSRLGSALAARPSALKVDASGNVLLHGTLGTSTGTVYLTIKFDPAGQLLWSRDYAGPARQDEAGQMTLDAMGNVYVTGRSPASNAINDVATLKYALDGTRLWVRRFAAADPLASDAGRDLAIDGDNNLYVAGGGDLGFLTLRYTTEGEQVWSASRTNELGTSPADFIAVDGRRSFGCGHGNIGDYLVPD